MAKRETFIEDETKITISSNPFNGFTINVDANAVNFSSTAESHISRLSNIHGEHIPTEPFVQNSCILLHRHEMKRLRALCLKWSLVKQSIHFKVDIVNVEKADDNSARNC